MLIAFDDEVALLLSIASTIFLVKICPMQAFCRARLGFFRSITTVERLVLTIYRVIYIKDYSRACIKYEKSSK